MITAPTLPVSKTVDLILKKLDKEDTIEVETHWGGIVTWTVDTENITAHGSAYIQLDEYGGGEFRRDAIKVSSETVDSLEVYDEEGDLVELNEEEDRRIRNSVKGLITYI